MYKHFIVINFVLKFFVPSLIIPTKSSFGHRIKCIWSSKDPDFTSSLELFV